MAIHCYIELGAPICNRVWSWESWDSSTGTFPMMSHCTTPSIKLSVTVHCPTNCWDIWWNDARACWLYARLLHLWSASVSVCTGHPTFWDDRPLTLSRADYNLTTNSTNCWDVWWNDTRACWLYAHLLHLWSASVSGCTGHPTFWDDRPLTLSRADYNLTTHTPAWHFACQELCHHLRRAQWRSKQVGCWMVTFLCYNCMNVFVCHNKKKVPDKWQARQVTQEILQVIVCVCVCVCACACQRKTKDRADGMREKCPFPSTGFEPVPLGYGPTVFPITPRAQARLASVKTNTSDTHPPAPWWNTIMQETLQLLSAGPRHQASARTSAESDEACQRKTKYRTDGMREKSAHSCVCVGGGGGASAHAWKRTKVLLSTNWYIMYYLMMVNRFFCPSTRCLPNLLLPAEMTTWKFHIV